MIVVDTNILAYLYLPGDNTNAASRLLDISDAWAVPLLWRSEFRNVLAGCMRRGEVELELALAIQAEAESLVAGLEYEVDSHQVLQLVSSGPCSAYDCEFVALAKSLGTQLVTLDKQVLKAYPGVAVPLKAMLA